MAENTNHIYKNFSHSGYSVAGLITVFQQCNERISVLDQHSTEDFKALNAAVRNYYKQVLTIQQIISQLPATVHVNHTFFSKEAEACLQYISDIITGLQFHDIIKQKLEHIQQTTQEIIHELASITKQAGTKETQPIKYLLILTEITKLHAAQLLQTNEDYQKAFAGIKTSLQGMEQNCKWMVNNFNKHFFQYQSTDIQEKLKYIKWLANQLSAQIHGSLLEIKYCESFAYEIEEINKDMHSVFSGWVEGIKAESQVELLKQLENLYTMESERMIHHQVFNRKENPHPEKTNTANNVDEQNLELF